MAKGIDASKYLCGRNIESDSREPARNQSCQTSSSIIIFPLLTTMNFSSPFSCRYLGRFVRLSAAIWLFLTKYQLIECIQHRSDGQIYMQTCLSSYYSRLFCFFFECVYFGSNVMLKINLHRFCKRSKINIQSETLCLQNKKWDKKRATVLKSSRRHMQISTQIETTNHRRHCLHICVCANIKREDVSVEKYSLSR